MEHPNQQEIISLIAELDAYQDTLYPPEARYALDLTSLEQSNVIFVVVRNSEGVAIGCCSLVLDGKVSELKRMYVRPDNRGQGIAASLLAKLESEAVKVSCELIQLETGPLQNEALVFYKKHGFSTCGAFGRYPENPLSVFMKKNLCE